MPAIPSHNPSGSDKSSPDCTTTTAAGSDTYTSLTLSIQMDMLQIKRMRLKKASNFQCFLWFSQILEHPPQGWGSCYFPRVLPASMTKLHLVCISFHIVSVAFLCRFIHGTHKHNDWHHLALHGRFHGSWYRLQSHPLLTGTGTTCSTIHPSSHGFVSPQQ